MLRNGITQTMDHKALEEFVRPLYSQKDEMHNFSHILRIKNNLEKIKKDYKGFNEKRLAFMLYFHGLKAWVKNNADKVISLGYSKEDIESLIRHSHSPKTEEEKLVHDANMLDNVGEQGIRKALAVGKKLGRTREETVQYLKDNIGKATFYTTKGKRLGEEGIRIVKEFISKQNT